MSSVIDVVDNPTQTPVNFETPGAMLKAARKKAGLSADDLAKELNLSPAKLEALENDEYEKLASNVFAQGYLRRYGKLVNVNDDLLVERFNEYLARMRETAEHVTQGEQKPSSVSSMLPRWLLPAAVFSAAVVVLAFIFISTAGDGAKGPVSEVQNRPDTSVQQQSANIEAEAEDNVVADSPSAPEVGGSVEESPPAIEPTENETALGEADTRQEALARPSSTEQAPARENLAVADDQTSQPEVSPVSTETGVLSFAFSDDCWVEVSNANGTVIHADLAKAGESLTVEGEPPFSVMLGNAQAASLSYNGEGVSVRSRPGNRTARFKVGN